MTITTETPYLESFGCLLEGEEGCDHDGPCPQWGFRCRICARPVDDGPCPEHAPREVPGLALVECSAEPRHYLWAAANDAYGTGCPACALDRAAEAHRCCEHSRHRAWRRWKVTHRLASRAYILGIARGGTVTFSPECRGCLTGFRTGRSPYVLGLRREWWFCLLRRRHLYEDSGLDGICDRCCPDPLASPPGGDAEGFTANPERNDS
jgi:hypothetical protein